MRAQPLAGRAHLAAKMVCTLRLGKLVAVRNVVVMWNLIVACNPVS